MTLSRHPSRFPGPAASRRARGFTLIELLVVIAFIGILSAIIIPTAGGARNAAKKAKVRGQFSTWSAAFETFRTEYGTYPQFNTAGALKLVNPPGTSTAPAQTHLFHDLMAGVRRDGSALTGAITGNPVPPLGQNSRRIRFVSFNDADLVTAADITAGNAVAAQLNYIRDAFYNTSIAVVTDANLNGVINGADTTGGFPRVTVAGGTTTLVPAAASGVTTAVTGGIRAGVMFYSAPPGATAETDLILSWK